ncbi:MAG: FtsX-like permease family protein [Actinobacteria bacterium]|nr:MAG: FtsX-like permease family protein [Actinomycetota bacterium]
MLRLSLKMTLARKGRLLLTSLAIILGTSFLSGTRIFSDTINNTFDQLFTDVFRDVNVYVRSSNSVESDFKSLHSPTDISVLETILKVPGVSAAVGDMQSYARVIGKDGKPLGKDQGPPTFGGIASESSAGLWKVESGRLPVGAKEMMLDRATADAGKFVVGDTVRVNASTGTREFSLVGIANYGDVSSPGGATFALFDQPTASEFLLKPGFVDAILVQGDGSLSDEELAKSIQAALPAEAKLETLTGAQITAETTSQIKTVLGFFTTFLMTFSFIALGVGCFVIYNVFSITAAQRQRESALLRAIGANRRQVTIALLVEALIIGVLGSVLGFITGIGLSQALSALLNLLGLEIPSRGLTIESNSIIFTVIVGTVITVLSAVLPALRAGRVSPLAAMRDTALDTVNDFRRRIIFSAVLLAGGAYGLVSAMNGAGAKLLGFGALGLFAGVLFIGPAISRKIAMIIGAPVAKLRGVTGAMARQNAARNPKRTSRTAAPLLIGVALVTSFTALAVSLKSQIRDTYGKSFRGDYALSVENRGSGGIPISITDQINALPEVEKATGISYVPALVMDKPKELLVINPKTTEGLYDIEMITGRQSDLTKDGILVESSKAIKQGLSIGSVVNVKLVDGRTVTLTVRGTHKNPLLKDPAGNYVVSREIFASSTTPLFDTWVYITIAKGVSDPQARNAISEISTDLGIGKLQSRNEFIDAQAAQVNTILALIYGLLFLSIIIAIVGIIITLLLSVFERKREIGLLRAIGMTRAQIRTMIRWESVITSLFGAVTGVVLGITMGVVIVVSVVEQGFSAFKLPITGTIVILIIAFIIGVVAAVFPAWRATRTNIISSIASN